tara:strand:- start:43 stop:741 length:699 start_codon:yes stop_codon:yes gene_type:complete
MHKHSIKDKYKVESIDTKETHEWLLHKHYLKRLTCISYAFGLFKENILVGVCTFGNALPSNMRKGFCGNKYERIVYELNRLCVNEGLDKNILSYFVSKTLSILPKPKILVSYADKGIGHNGYIYQATNWIFTGKSHTQLDWKLKGKEHIHSRTLMDEFAFQDNRVEKLKEKYGDDLYQVERPPKNRYIYFIGTKKQKKYMMNNLKYEIKPYPKGENKRYDASYKPVIQTRLF